MSTTVEHDPLRRIRSCSTVMLVAVIVLGACHGNAKKKADPATDRALAKTLVPTEAELPGFTPSPAKGPVALPAVAKRNFAKCLDTAVTIFDDVPGVATQYSPDFSTEGATLQSSVKIEPTRHDVDQLWKGLANINVERCLQQMFISALGRVSQGAQGVVVDTLVSKFTVGIGDRSIGFAARISSAIDPGAFYVELLFVARGRAAIQVTTNASSKAFDRAKEIAVARAIYDRIGARAN